MSADRDTILEGQAQVNSSARLLESLRVFSENVPVGATDATNSNNVSKNFVVYAFDNFGLILEDVDGESFTGEAFSVDLGPIKEAIQSDGSIDEDSLVRMASALPNATAAVIVPESLFNSDTTYQNNNSNYNNTGSESVSLTNNPSVHTHRLIFSVFLQSSIFQNEKTDCSKKGIGSVIVSLQINSSLYKLANTNIKINFQENREVLKSTCMQTSTILHNTTNTITQYCCYYRCVKTVRYQKHLSPYAAYSKLKVCELTPPTPTHPPEHTHMHVHTLTRLHYSRLLLFQAMP